MDRVTQIDLPGRLWKATRGKTAETDQQMPCFVAGPENRLTAVAINSLLRAVPRDDWKPPALTFNPLILLGATGCGKSHLAGGIANHWQTVLSAQPDREGPDREGPDREGPDREGPDRERPDRERPDREGPASAPQTSGYDLLNFQTEFRVKIGRGKSQQVANLSPHDFGRLYQQEQEQDKLIELRQALTHLRLLVLEDLHLLRLSPRIQQELRLTIDHLLADGAMILVTTQQPLTMIPSLEGNLRDRLSAGLTVRVKPPGYAARLELLQLAADRRGTELDLNSAKRLSRKIEGVAPQLFQALSRLEHERTRANLDQTGLSRTNPKQTTNRGSHAKVSQLRDEPNHETFPQQENITIRQILAVVARYFSVSQTQIRSHSRRRTIVHARGVVVTLTRMLTDLSYAQIGQALGNRDHTTTMHAHRKLQQLFSTDPSTQECIEDLKRILTAA